MGLSQGFSNPSAILASTKNGGHDLHGRRIRIARGKGDGLGDLDQGRCRSRKLSKVNLVAWRVFDWNDPCVRDVATVPFAKVHVGLGIRFVGGDVPDHQKVSNVGPEKRGVFVREILSPNGIEGGRCGDFAIGVQLTKVCHGNHVVAHNLGRRFGVLCARRERGFDHVQSILRKGGANHRIGHQPQQLSGLALGTLCHESSGGPFKRCVHRGEAFGKPFGRVGVAALTKHGPHQVHGACLFPFHKGGVVEHKFPLYLGCCGIFHQIDLKAIRQFEHGGFGRSWGRLLCPLCQAECKGQESDGPTWKWHGRGQKMLVGK